ncbi:MAG: VOC family protein [Sphingomonas sp.]|uniref:VOC family protein n=1 Tax=Sphingomonas sp. TaxID=28214 RepID=UPI0026107AB5|nr:VOC family protein [Sphingomonas sp.]MDK2766603.1 VOC family protein [Sphingomonas sp.]
MTMQERARRVQGIHRLALRVPDLGEARRFYRDVWLLEDRGSDLDFAGFRSGGEDHDDLVLAEGSPQIAHLAFQVASTEELEAIATQLAAAGFSPQPVAEQGLFRSDQAAIAVQDSDGRQVWLVAPQPDASELVKPPAVLAPNRIGHIVLWTPDQDAAERFYATLGFQVTDRTNAGMSFLRCNADHHSLALMKSREGRTGLQHVAYDVGSLDNVMRNFARLRSLGVNCVWGVGRHGPGNNVFSYYTDPAGNYIEYYGEMEQFDANAPVEPQIWGPQHKGDVWGVAGVPPLGFRE